MKEYTYTQSSAPKTDRGTKTKQKLLVAAEEVFGEMGFFQAGITDVTKKAKVSQGTFYTYFQSKEDIYRELVMDMQKQLRKAIRLGTQGIHNRLELEKKGFEIFFNFLKEHRYLFRLFRQAEFVDENLHRNYFQTFTKGYIEGLAEAQDKGEVRKLDPEMLVYIFMGITDYLGMKWVLWENREVTDSMIEEVMSFIKYGIANNLDTKGE
ncbi:TetR/AcrR family transcriptional regulator [Neobacillus rhizophilus]|uniref:TetR/AcrR family transcriptional regulator n=1 Tax=Neobacillus rhizophilus TaxID=2833579 RepID=A0A942U9P9_9BACI|nr:TetR/AcrR family transcriptional regulator [Neobacillus rhizophilus]MBS4214961.1 TetR/AcrR family transcriptional regulator [Neobacillus rhizophilus]